MTDILKSILLGIVEGVTEFLPVSSTGHLRLLTHVTGPIVSETFGKTFDVVIQFGAILAVLVYFRAKIADLLGVGPAKADPEAAPTAPAERRDSRAQRMHVLKLIGLATIPLAPGFLLAKKSEAFFLAHPGAEPHAIAAALMLGGIIMIVLEILPRRIDTRSMETMTWRQALAVGCAQIVAAVFPGTSRSAATILTSMLAGTDRATAAEFSFFIAIPAMCAAAGYKMLKLLGAGGVSRYELTLLVIGTMVSFMVAYLVIAAFMGFIRKYTFVPFGLYRVLLGIAVLLAM